MGKQLIHLKAALSREQFHIRIQGLGIAYSTALNYMAMAHHFHDANDEFLDAVGGMTKLGVLASLENASDLVKGQPIGALTLETIAAMSLDELKVAVRREEKALRQEGALCSDRLAAANRSWLSERQDTSPTQKQAYAKDCAQETLNCQEQRLLLQYRQCGAAAKQALLQMASLLGTCR